MLKERKKKEILKNSSKSGKGKGWKERFRKKKLGVSLFKKNVEF